MKYICSLLIYVLTICLLTSCGSQTVMLRCPSCGELSEKTVEFCADCGASLSKKAKSENTDVPNTKEPSNNSEPTQNTTKSTFDFLNQIKNNTTITLADQKFELYGETNYSNNNVSVMDGTLLYKSGYEIHDINALTINGDGQFVIDGNLEFNDWSAGLIFSNCKDIIIDGIDFVVSDTKNNSVTTIMVIFQNCENVTIKNCTFDGAWGAIDISESSGKIENCSFKYFNKFSTIGLWGSTVDVNQSIFDNCSTVCNASQSTASFYNCTIENISGIDSTFLVVDATDNYMEEGTYYDDSIIKFEKCKILNNLLQSFFAKQKNYEYNFQHDSITFEDCTFSNNSYCNGDTKASNYINCSFDNNEVYINHSV